jgi:hypothetical protein
MFTAVLLVSFYYILQYLFEQLVPIFPKPKLCNIRADAVSVYLTVLHSIYQNKSKL